MRDRRLTVLLALAAPLIACLVLVASAAGAYVPGEVLVGRGETTSRVPVPPGSSVAATVARLRARPGVEWAVPDYIAHATAISTPNDPGVSGNTPGGWQQTQWNFDGTYGIDAPEAWANVIADGAPGGAKVVVAVLDTGVAYANRGKIQTLARLQQVLVCSRATTSSAEPPTRTTATATAHSWRSRDRRGHRQPSMELTGLATTPPGSCPCGSWTAPAKATPP